jgi:nitroreductase
MDFYDVIRQRRSIRSFKSDPVPDEAVERIISAVDQAPSACNLQPFTVKLIRNKELKNALAASCRQDFPGEAPLILAVIAHPQNAWNRGADGFNSADVDIAIAMEHAILAATAEGLGSCWLNRFDPQKTAELLGLPENEELVMLMDIGYAAEDAAPAPLHGSRKDITETVKYL